MLGYRPQGARQFRRLTLGVYGPLTTEQARDEALRQLSATTQGVDPLTARRAARGGLTVRELGATYLDEVERRRKTGTTREYRRLWTKHIFPALGTKQVSTVTAGDVPLDRSLNKTPYVANRVVARLTTFFAYAITEGALPSKENPTRGIELYPEKARERFLTKAEFGRLGAALSKGGIGLPPAPEHRTKPKKPENQKHRPKKRGQSHSRRIRSRWPPSGLLALTGCRENEILSLRWDAVDFERGHLRLEDTKTGKSVRPLGQSAPAVLEPSAARSRQPLCDPRIKDQTSLEGDQEGVVRSASRGEAERPPPTRSPHSFASVPAATRRVAACCAVPFRPQEGGRQNGMPTLEMIPSNARPIAPRRASRVGSA